MHNANRRVENPGPTRVGVCANTFINVVVPVGNICVNQLNTEIPGTGCPLART